MAIAIALERVAEIALRAQYIADVLERDPKIALPIGVARVFLGEMLENLLAVAIAFQRSVEIALRHLHAADARVADCDVAARSGAGRIGCRKLFADCHAL